MVGLMTFGALASGGNRYMDGQNVAQSIAGGIYDISPFFLFSTVTNYDPITGQSMNFSVGERIIYSGLDALFWMRPLRRSLSAFGKFAGRHSRLINRSIIYGSVGAGAIGLTYFDGGTSQAHAMGGAGLARMIRKATRARRGADEAFESLARLRRDLDIPAASADDAFTLSRLNIDGKAPIFGINGGVSGSDEIARTLQQLAAELGHKGPTFQLLRHAEGDALLQAFNRSVGPGRRATLFVDNTFVCQGCKSGLNNMRRLLGLEELTVVDRAGNILRFPRR